jgi:hypothetical protein
MNFILLIHLFACFAMTGIIWLVQLIIYPFFKLVGKNEFHSFHQFHMKQMTIIVAPLMLLELLTAIILLFNHREPIYFFNLISVASLSILTFFKNVPLHHKLIYDLPKSKNDLILWNWPRTLIWTLRSFVLFYLCGRL